MIRCTTNVCINKVQHIVSSCCKVNVLVKFGYNCFKCGVVKIPSENEEAIRVGCLQITDNPLEFIECSTSFSICASTRWDVNSNDDHHSKLSWDVKRPASDCQDLHKF